MISSPLCNKRHLFGPFQFSSTSDLCWLLHKSAFCLQETWLDEESDTSLFQIDGYTLICQGKICSSQAGLAIYLSNKY